MKSWKELTTDSEQYAKQSKPEFLAIVEILKDNDNGALSVTQIYELVEKNYPNRTSKRQIYYYIDLMQKREILKEEYNNDKEKVYSLNKIEEKVKTPIQKSQLYLTIISIFVFMIKLDRLSLGFMSGVIIFLIIIQWEFFLFKIKKGFYSFFTFE